MKKAVLREYLKNRETKPTFVSVGTAKVWGETMIKEIEKLVAVTEKDATKVVKTKKPKKGE